MTAGRKPQPTKLKIIRGNPGGRKLNKNEPELPSSNPTPPNFLSAEAVVEWGRVVGYLSSSGLLTEIDRGALATYCQLYGRWEQAEMALASLAKTDPINRGLVIETTNGNAIQNPLVGIANKAAADLNRYCLEFGMTPSARSRVTVDKKKSGNKFAENCYDD